MVDPARDLGADRIRTMWAGFSGFAVEPTSRWDRLRLPGFPFSEFSVGPLEDARHTVVVPTAAAIFLVRDGVVIRLDRGRLLTELRVLREKARTR